MSEQSQQSTKETLPSDVKLFCIPYHELDSTFTIINHFIDEISELQQKNQDTLTQQLDTACEKTLVDIYTQQYTLLKKQAQLLKQLHNTVYEQSEHLYDHLRDKINEDLWITLPYLDAVNNEHDDD